METSQQPIVLELEDARDMLALLSSEKSVAEMREVLTEYKVMALEKMVSADADSWAIEFATAQFMCFNQGIDYLAAKLFDACSQTTLAECLADFTPEQVKALLAERRAEGNASLYRRFTERGQRIFFPPNRARGGAAAFDPAKRDLETKFIPTCYNCPGQPATFRLMPCRCNCICRRCATEIKLGSWTRCPVCRAQNKGRVAHL